MNDEEIALVAEQIRQGRNKFYLLFAAVVMPDHVHLILQPHENIELSRILKGVKGVSSRRINEKRGTRGRLWQAESFDRIIRNDEELSEKLQYMFYNPVKGGLCEDPATYCGWICDA